MRHILHSLLWEVCLSIVFSSSENLLICGKCLGKSCQRKLSFPSLKPQQCFRLLRFWENTRAEDAGTVLISLWNRAITPLNTGLELFFFSFFGILLSVDNPGKLLVAYFAIYNCFRCKVSSLQWSNSCFHLGDCGVRCIKKCRAGWWWPGLPGIVE